jgi:glycosyltransferase involved in cell wall biosynthesis
MRQAALGHSNALTSDQPLWIENILGSINNLDSSQARRATVYVNQFPGVWHLLNSDAGGVGRYVEQLVDAQARINQPPAALIRVMAPPGLIFPASVRLDPYLAERQIWGLNQWRFAVLSWWHVRGQPKQHPAVVHTHSFSFAVPDVHTIHGFYHAYWNGRAQYVNHLTMPKRLIWTTQYQLLTSLERRMLSSAKEVAFTSTNNREYAETVLNIRRPDHFHVLLPGVDVIRYHPGRRANLIGERQRHFPEIAATGRWLLFVGHDFIGKGLVRLLRALARLGSSGDWMLLVFGDDPRNLSAARAEAEQIGHDRVRFMGADKRLEIAFGVCDLLLMDSISEGFPLVLLEAMASGCVPAVTSFGGVTDIVENGVNGLVLPSAEEIAVKAIELDAVRMREMSSNSITTGGSRTWETVARDYADLYAVASTGRVG